MPFNSNLDESLFSKVWESDEARLTVKVCSYNKGPKKLQISRENRDPEGNFRFAKLGRMSKEEAAAILPLIQEALKSMD